MYRNGLLCSKNFCCYDNKSDNFKFSRKSLNKRVLEDSGVGLMSKYKRKLDEAVNFTITNKGFRYLFHMVATKENNTKKGLIYFYPRRQVQNDEFQTKPTKLKDLMQCKEFIGRLVLNLYTMQLFLVLRFFIELIFFS